MHSSHEHLTPTEEIIEAALAKQKTSSKRKATVVSVIVHGILIVVAGMIVAMTVPEEKKPEFVAPLPQRPRLEPRKLEMQVRVNQLTKRSARPKLEQRLMVNAPSSLALPDIKKNPDATPKKLHRNFSTMGTSGIGSGVGGGYGTGTGGGIGGMGLPPTMADRCSAANRSTRMRSSGGRASSEKAVQNALAWLQTQQNADGSFGEKSPVAMTGLTLLAFLGHCETPESPIYGVTVKRALDYLVSMTGKGNGGLTASAAGGNGASYEHGIATYAMGEAYIMTGDPAYRTPFKIGVERIIKAQNPAGGWDYGMTGKTARNDTSVSGWQIQALKSAYLAGLDEVSGVNESLDLAMENLKRVYNEDNGTFGYTDPDGKNHNLVGVGIFGLTMWKHKNSREAKGGVQFLLRKIEKENQTDKRGDMLYKKANLYGLYYDTQGMFAQGGRDWRKFNDWFQKPLTDAQLSDGSWPPTGQNKFVSGGEDTPENAIYRTALNTLMLEVYYRYLPVVDM